MSLYCDKSCKIAIQMSKSTSASVHKNMSIIHHYKAENMSYPFICNVLQNLSKKLSREVKSLYI